MGRVVVIHPLKAKLATLVGDGALRGDGRVCFDIFFDMVEESNSMEFWVNGDVVDGHGVVGRCSGWGGRYRSWFI